MLLARRLREIKPGALAGEGEGALDSLLAQRLSSARAAFPGVALSDEDFLIHLARHLPEGLGGLAALELDSLFFACACARGDRAALARFDAQLLAELPGWLARVPGANPDDVRQELQQKLLLGEEPRLLGYTGAHPLWAFVRVTAIRCAIDLQRAQKPASGGDGLDELWDGPDPALDLAKLRDANALRELLHDALAALPPHERGLLRLHYLEGLSLDRLAAMERVHRATVARWLADARATVLDRVRALLAERLKLSELEGESLLRFVRSRLDLSLRRVLSPVPPESGSSTPR